MKTHLRAGSIVLSYRANENDVSPINANINVIINNDRQKRYKIYIIYYSHLIFAFEYEHVGDFAERYAQMYDFGLGDLVGYVAYVYHSRRLVVGSFV